MAVDKTTLALPYGKAAFQYAQANDALAQWERLLRMATLVAQDNDMIRLMQNPNVAATDMLNIFLDICSKPKDEDQRNFLKLLSENNRLPLLPAITDVFIAKRAEYEQTVDVQVTSFLPLDDQEQRKISEAMQRRLQRKVELHVTVDNSLYGGAIIRFGDDVIDGSLKSKLAKLQQALVA